MKVIAAVVLLGLTVAAQAQCPSYQFVVFKDSNRKASKLVKITENYKRALGFPNNANNMGPLANGHRQIVWDNPAVPFDFPGDFFDKTVTFGINFKAKGGSFAVSNPATPPPEDDRFSSILPVAQARTFKTFSAPRLFTPIKGNKVFVDFKVPGSDIAAGVTGYGAMFVDVDEARKTSMKYFDRNGCLIARVEAQALDKGLSFAGITVLDPRNPGKLLPVIARVEMKLGDISVERFTNTWTGRERTDLVVVDDLLYGEPQAL